jgi:hypothetical protein
MKELTRPALYNYLLKKQAKIQAALEEDAARHPDALDELIEAPPENAAVGVEAAF